MHHQIMELDSSKLLANCGTYADRTNFTEYIQKNIVLYELNNGLQLTTHAAANYIRGQVDQNR
jgi:20S proteasome alpha/beta subunit